MQLSAQMDDRQYAKREVLSTKEQKIQGKANEWDDCASVRVRHDTSGGWAYKKNTI